MKEPLTRKELHDLVWTRPLRTVARGMGISDVALAKTCRKANISVPPRGYWARKEARRAVQKAPLPLRFPGSSDSIGGERYAYYGSDWRERMLAEPIPPVPAFEESMDDLAKRVRSIVGNVKFIADLERPHPLVAKLLAHDEECRAELRRRGWGFDKPKYESAFAIRWLKILNSLFLALARIGCSFTMGVSKYESAELGKRPIGITVGSRCLTLKLAPAPSGKKRASPEREGMRLSLDTPFGISEAWLDEKGVRLERKLTEFVLELLIAAETDYRRAKHNERDRMIARRTELEAEIVRVREEKEREEREAAEKRRQQQVEQLLHQAHQLAKADRIRTYVKAASAQIAGQSISEKQVENWAKWALQHADGIDPIQNGLLSQMIAELVGSDVI